MTLETWDPSDILSALCQDKKAKKTKRQNNKKTKWQKDNMTKRQKTSRWKDKKTKESQYILDNFFLHLNSDWCLHFTDRRWWLSVEGSCKYDCQSTFPFDILIWKTKIDSSANIKTLSLELDTTSTFSLLENIVNVFIIHFEMVGAVWDNIQKWVGFLYVSIEWVSCQKTIWIVDTWQVHLAPHWAQFLHGKRFFK